LLKRSEEIMKDLKNRFWRFDNIEIDVQNLQVTVGGEIRPLEPKSFRLLLFLVENPGRAIPKDEMMAAVWTGTFVSDNSLAQAIAQIRKALNDGAKVPRYIETVPSVGYRFLVHATADVASEAAGATSPPSRPPARRRVFAVAAVASAAVLLLVVLQVKRSSAPSLPPKLVLETTYEGSESYPRFSPDGRQIAFYWSGEKGVNPGIYVKLQGELNPLRLTTGPDAFPVWSPDGARIAFLRGIYPGERPTGSSIYVVPALGGAERKILDIEASGQMSWSPDGKWLAFAVGGALGSAIFVLSPDVGEPRRVSSPPSPGFDNAPAFSPDGHRLAWARCSSRYRCDVYVQDLGPGGVPAGAPHQITHEGDGIYGLTWSRDGQSLIYSAEQMHFIRWLWQVSADGRQPSRRLEIAGPQASAPSASPAADRLVFEKSQENGDIWRYRADSGLDPLITSSLSDFAPQYSPDGTRIVFCSDRAGEGMEIWVARADGSGPVQVTRVQGRNQGTPRWSPDGRWIAFDSAGTDGHVEIDVIEPGGSTPRKIVPGGNSPFWSADGQWIYFNNNKGQIWRIRFAGGQAELVAQGGMGYVSPDGATLFYTKQSSGPLFARTGVDGDFSRSQERQILPFIYYKEFFPVRDGVYYIGARGEDGLYPLQFYSFSAKASRVLTKISGQIFQGLTVSPDGKSILVSRTVTVGSDLMTIMNF
jgi:Tol biopolymer transport system component/DNA-binding winged helix-turn-helix (wHTH) protein